METLFFQHDECETSLEEAQQQYSLAKAILQTITTLVVVLDSKGQVIYLNPAGEQLGGYCTADLAQRPFWETLVAPEEAGQVRHSFAELITGDDSHQEGESHLITRSGERRRIAWSQTLLRNPAGDITYIIGAGVDVTEARAAETRLRLTMTALEAAANAVVITDREGHIEWVNAAFQQLTGYAFEEIAGKTLRILRSGKHSAAFYAHLWNTILAGQIWHGELLNQRKDGSSYFAEQTITPVYDNESETITHFIGIQQNITRRKHDEETLRLHTAELESRNEELDAFAHTVAHDLKTPLALITGYAELFNEDYTTLSPEEQHKYNGIILQSGRKMVNIINELLLLASTRKADIMPQPLDMRGILREAQERLQDMIEKYRAQITLPDDLPFALGHAAWIEEVWINYLSNAIKYGGEPPQIEIGAEEQPDGMIRFWVRDHGPGIAQELQCQLFKPFTQLSQVRAQGHGLGLSIVRRIVDKLGGKTGVESAPGEGSTFSFTLPRAPELPNE